MDVSISEMGESQQGPACEICPLSPGLLTFNNITYQAQRVATLIMHEAASWNRISEPLSTSSTPFHSFPLLPVLMSKGDFFFFSFCLIFTYCVFIASHSNKSLKKLVRVVESAGSFHLLKINGKILRNSHCFCCSCQTFGQEGNEVGFIFKFLDLI